MDCIVVADDVHGRAVNTRFGELLCRICTKESRVNIQEQPCRLLDFRQGGKKGQERHLALRVAASTDEAANASVCGERLGEGKQVRRSCYGVHLFQELALAVLTVEFTTGSCD